MHVSWARTRGGEEGGEGKMPQMLQYIHAIYIPHWEYIKNMVSLVTVYVYIYIRIPYNNVHTYVHILCLMTIDVYK